MSVNTDASQNTNPDAYATPGSGQATGQGSEVYGEDYNPYNPPSTKLNKSIELKPYKKSFMWKIYLFIYVAFPIAILFSADVIKLFNYGNSEIILYTVKAHWTVETLNWATFAASILGLIGFIWEKRMFSKGFWIVMFWICFVWTAGYYIYEAIREYSNYTTESMMVILGFTSFNFVKNMLYAGPAVYAMYRYCYSFKWIWAETKKTERIA